MMTGEDQSAVIAALDRLIEGVAPEVSRLAKYGGTLYTLWPEEKEGQFCGVFPYKEYVQLSLSDGAVLADPAQVLQGTGKFRRHVNFASVESIDAVMISALLQEAAARSRGR
jgi:hypothetical protein